ncbi:fatty acid desaturase [Acinetobacter junii]
MGLYEDTRAKIGDEDLAHIRNVAAYSKAIKARSQVLILEGNKPDALKRGIILHALHVLLEFSELGHNILHGSYDHLPNVGEFHSKHWTWDFVADPKEWQVMHHQNHHPYTNIVGLDHDIGYSFLRVKSGQAWFVHHLLQLPVVLALALLPSYYFTFVTAISAARTEGRKKLSKATLTKSLSLIKNHAYQHFIKDPLSNPKRAIPVLLGNYLGTILGYDLTMAILFLEHHAPSVQLFTDPGPDETQDQYFKRQILATSNFTPFAKLDNYFKTLLEKEVIFDNRPSFDIFYGGLVTHIEHHLFPDLPCNRQREIQTQVREICAKHKLPYLVTPFEEVIPTMILQGIELASPAGEHEQGKLKNLLKKPLELAQRIKHGVRYTVPTPMTYLNKPQFFNVTTRVQKTVSLTEDQALLIHLEKPIGWESVMWEAGAFISIRIPVGSETLVRQYSLLKDSTESMNTLELTVKRVENGRVSNYINDNLRQGDNVMLVGVPQSSPDFVMTHLPKKVLLLAGGVGITPIISMMRKIRRKANHTDGVLIYFNRNNHSILFEQELRDIAAQSRFKVHFICDSLDPHHVLQHDISQGRLNVELLKQHVSSIPEREVYVCAPAGFIEASRSILLNLDLPAHQFHTESFIAPTIQHQTDGKEHIIRFARSHAEITVDGATTLLEAARRAGISIPSGCERGLCRACVCTKLTGTTHLEEAKPVPNKRITTCNSLARSELVVLDI